MSSPINSGLRALGYTGGTGKAVTNALGPTRAYGGRFATGAGAAALGTAALVTDSVIGGNEQVSTEPAKVPQDSASLPSLQHLEAPLNGMISAWLEQNAPTVDALFKMTGLKPTQLVDKLINGLFNRGMVATPENINSVALDILDSAPERAALRHDNWEHKEDAPLHVVDPNSVAWSNTRTAVATISTAAELFPTGLHGLIALREALFMNPRDFEAAVEFITQRNLSAELGNIIQDRAQRVKVIY